MGTKLYVGGLPYSVTEQQLNDLFSQQGTVSSAKVITDKFTGQSRGFAFVEMSTTARKRFMRSASEHGFARLDHAAFDQRAERHADGRTDSDRERSQASRKALRRNFRREPGSLLRTSPSQQ